MKRSGNFSVELVKPQLVFSAAHFITFRTGAGEEICESLHGHNYAVRCTVWGELNEEGYVIDFIALRDGLAEIVHDLDHKVLLAGSHPRIAVRQENGEIVAEYQGDRWVFPENNCRILPVSNTTAELLAMYISEKLVQRLSEHLRSASRISVGVDENGGQWGNFETVLNGANS